MRSSSPPESHLELPAKASDLWMFQMFSSVGSGWGGCLHPSVPLGHSRKPFGLCSVHASSSVPEPRTLQRIVHAPGGVADSALVASSLETPVLLLLATCVASTEDSTGEEI